MENLLAGKVAIVTGARSERGIGYGAALKLAEAGANVVITARFSDYEGNLADYQGDEKFADFQRLAGRIEEKGVRCLALPMDVVDRNQVTTAVNCAAEKLGGIDILFNNAGIGFGELFVDTNPEQFNSTWNVNVMGAVNVSQAVIPHMNRQGGGSIINNSSIYGLGADPYISAYVMTKHALIGMTKAMALELGEKKIRVNAIAPGMVVTDMGDVEYQLWAEVMGCSFAEAKQYIADKNAFKRGGEPSEVGTAVVFLASEMASFVTGIVMPVAAGQPCGL